MKNLFFFTICVFVVLGAEAQGIKNIMIDESANGKSLAFFLAELEKEHKLDFIFNKEDVDIITVSGVSKKMYLSNYLDLLLIPAGFAVIQADEKVLFIVSEPLRRKFGRRNYLVFEKKGSNKQVVKGILKENGSDEPIVGAQVVIPTTGAGVLTDEKGFFELKVPEGISELELRYVGYETASFLIGFSPYGSTKPIELTLLPSSVELQSVTVTAEGSDRNVQAVVPGVERMSIEVIKELPTFLGEVDPVKSLTTLPGVSTVGELSSGINVRGGETGQNLIIQDGAIIYNPSHLFGFFSAFNPDFVNDVALFKGGGPARFGGRVSSVLDVKLRNGDAVKHTVSGGVGLVSSRLGIEGPIKKNKASYLLGGRISYTNWLLKATENIQLVNSSAQFYDITAKVFTQLNENNFLSITGYRSYDDFRLASDSTISWGTTNVSIRWDHTFNEKVLSTLNLSGSSYFSRINNDSEIDAFQFQNSIQNVWLKSDYIYRRMEGQEFNFGFEAIGTKLEPGEIDPVREPSNILPIDIHDQNVLEAAAYLQGDFTLSEKWALSAGIRYSHFFRFGEDIIYTFDYSDIKGRYPAVVDSITYQRGEIIQDYGGLEPRLSLRYLLNETASIKASFYRTYQYLHLISNTASATPQDYWVASGPYLRPEIGDQVSLGYFKNFRNDRYELSVETYYKNISNAVDYIEGADITLNKKLEAGLLGGKGLAYGVELLARKNSGRFYGWVSYTYSRSLRQFKPSGQIEGINEGNFYPAPFDQPNNLSVILNYKLGPRTIFSTNFSYSTGRPITIPISKFSYDSYLSVLNYSQRNEYRIPDYHRLDLSLTFKGQQKKNARFRGDWVFSVFNVYSRDNAYSIFFSRFGTAKKLAILGSVFPSITYNFSF